MQLGVIDFSEKHANIGTVVWATVAFDSLKLYFTTAPLLAYPDNDRIFCLETDASDFTTRVALSIEQNRKWHPIAFSSHSMTPEAQNYPVADRKCLVSSDH